MSAKRAWPTVLLLAPLFVFAQSYPAKPIRIIAPFPPGGTTDTMCRIVAQRLTESLGKQVVVENRPGAAGKVGHEAAARAPADGYTLLLTAKGSLVTNRFLYKNLGYDPLNDYAPITVIASAAPVMVLHPSLPARTVKEFVALAKARPGQLNFGSGGKGTTSHVIGEVFKAATGVKLVHVPYKGGALAINDLIAGHIELSFSDMVPAVPHIKSGRLRGVAVTTPERSPTIPDVPTMAESGITEPFPQQWWGLAAPRGTPAAIIERINGEMAQMIQRPEVKERFTELGVFTVHTTPERMLDMIRNEAPEMEKYLKMAGVEPE
ncbi:MAG: Bug family tripartite tricarboxylate transporter substrate binding protein [Rhodospirillaceae bacterium]